MATTLKDVTHALSIIMGREIDDATTVRIVDSLCGLAGHEATVDPAERLRIGADVTRQWIIGLVDAWGRQVAARSVPAAEPLAL